MSLDPSHVIWQLASLMNVRTAPFVSLLGGTLRKLKFDYVLEVIPKL